MLIRTFSLFVAFGLASTTSFAADVSFVGQWKVNPEKGQYSGVQSKIEDLGGDKFKFISGDHVETIVFDGKEYPSERGGTWSVTKTGPNTWKSVRTHNGKISSTSIWTLSDDGDTYTSVTEGTRADGSTFGNTSKSKRIASGPGLAGTWESTEYKMIHSAVPCEIATYEGDGVSLIRPGSGARVDLKFDGKDYPDVGPRLPEGSTASARRIDERTMEISWKLKGKLKHIARMQLAEDGKTLSITSTVPGVEKQEVQVFDRQ